MGDTNFINQGIDFIKEAVAKDKADDLQGAFTLYSKGLEYLVTGLKYERNPKAKAMIESKITEYMTRAEEIKKQLAEPPAPKKKAVAGGSDDDDKDKAKFKAALSQAIVSEKPNVKWDDIAGLEQAKSLLKESVILPIKFPQLFTGKRTPWRGILLYGPPGTGKSYLAKAVATEADSTFFSVSSSDLVSKYVGDSERLVKQLFEMAREAKPSIIFIDEIDSLCGNRTDGEADSSRRVKTEFLVQMQGVGHSNEGVLVLGATNTPWDLDPAIRRRFEKRIYIPLPDAAAREVMFRVHLGSTPNNLVDSDFRDLGTMSAGLSGSDISGVVRDALMEPIRSLQLATHFKKIRDPSGARPYLLTPCAPSHAGAIEMDLFSIKSEDLCPMDVTAEDFRRMTLAAKPSVGEADLARYVQWTEEFGQEG
ncbi:Vesicle-fusing ATPase [Plasmodiophora brassicae]